MPEAQHPVPPGPDDLQRRRREIGRGLRRSHYAVLAASLMVGLLAIAAVWLSREARRRADEAHEARQRAEANAAEAHRASDRLWRTSSHAAALERSTRKPGQRTKALEIIREAAAWQPSRELRDEALSALLLPDVGKNLIWHAETGFEYAAAYDTGFEQFIQNCDHGRAIVRRATDGAAQMDLKGLGDGTPFCQFSPDGRLAAIAFRGGQIGVWDWRTTNLMAKFEGINAEFGHPPFDFSPEGRHLWLLASPTSLREYALETGQPERLIMPLQRARSIRLSPSGRWAAIAGGKNLEVWDLSSRSQRATLALSNSIWRLAWQPGEERLAVGCADGLFLWDIGASEAVAIRRGGATRFLFFSADGDILFSFGDGLAGQLLSVRDRQVLIEMSAVAALELSRDQTRLSVLEGHVGYGIQRFLPPAGRRDWLAPPSLGRAHWSLEVDPQERWLLTAHSAGWLIRDAQTGRELARAGSSDTLAANFSADGSSVLAWTQAGLQRWRLLEAAGLGQLTVGAPEIVWSLAGQSLDLAVFAAGRRYTAFSQKGQVTVVDLEHPGKPVRFRLRLPRDNAHYLSPDGRWLVTGHIHQHGLDLYDCRSGKFIRTFAQDGVASPVFNPHDGRLFTCTAAEHCEWNPETGELKRKIPWRAPSGYQAFSGFARDGRLALVKCSSSALQLYDLEAGRDFAALNFRDPLDLSACHWSRDGQRLFLFGRDGGVTRLDLRALRAELEHLGLNWSDDDPGHEFPERQAPATVGQGANRSAEPVAAPPALGLAQPAKLVWLVSAGLVVSIGIGFYILRYQRRLFTSFLETETLSEQRAHELRDTHAALAHSEKMRALGTLAAGVAHDFNNLLSVIRLSSELIEEQTQPEGTTKENFESIQHAVQRGRAIVNSMLGYARDDGQARPFAPVALLSDAVALLSKPFLSGLVLQVEVDPSTPELIGRKGRVEQMLLNLIVNAAEAMSGRGTLRLAAREVGEASGCVLPPRASARYVEVSVADTGPGIPSEVLPRIFEPFFTTKTKDTQHGTGLGLSMLYTMAREDGIGVAVESEPGRGMTFRLLLPVEAAAHDSKSVLSPASNPAGGGPAPIPHSRSAAPEAPVGMSRPLAKSLENGQT